MIRRKGMCFGCWPKIKPAKQPDLDPALEVIIKKCGGNLERVVKYMLSATEQEVVCDLCENKAPEGCVGLADCAAAVARYLEERDGNV